eukprot:TRINITY_DN4309_c0_g1_i1.p1 TRINITY_DN4309_c0_g1~~TRINITY_DN4309_c0_g1_i1.p1  ORF type:complete len:259 (+),score=33.91 TRINITY_DN4309_c0_g1_i1:425-1201(+)
MYEYFKINGSNTYNHWYTTQAGYAWKYSHTGSALAGLLVEIITNQAFWQYCESNFFQPLGMYDTHWLFNNFGPNISRVAYPHTYNKETKRLNTIEHYSFYDYPNGGLKTTVLDFAKFLKMLMSGGTVNNVQFLSQASVTLMTELVPIRGQYDRQTVGMWRIFKERSVIGHDGGERGFRTLAGFDPETNNAIIWFSNTWPDCECFVPIGEEIFTQYFGSSASKIATDLHEVNREAYFRSLGLPLPRRFQISPSSSARPT